MAFAGNLDHLRTDFMRHLARDRDADLADAYAPRQVFELEIQLQCVFDLTDRNTLRALGIENAPSCFADRNLARATAGFLRNVHYADGLLVPSLFDSEQEPVWNLIVFLDRIDGPFETVVTRVSRRSTFQATP
jgi:hypothetical protein